MERTLYDSVHQAFRQTVRDFIAREIQPYDPEWDRAGIVDKAMFRKAGEQGLLGMDAPDEYGGTGVQDFRFNCVVNEEVQRMGVTASGFCITLHNDICMPYLLKLADDEQKARWVPATTSGESMLALAMTEPAIGSDLASMRTTAKRDGDDYVVNGSKTFITNGINADLVITAVKTDPDERHRGISLLVIEEGMEGFERGRNLEKIGLHAQDTAELFFQNVRVPAKNLLGEEGRGFYHLVDNLPQERLSIAITGVAHAWTAFELTLDYVKERQAFGRPVGTFQANKHRLAELKTELEIAQVYVDRQVEALNAGELTAEDAAMAKWWCTELQKRTMDTCLQLHGGYGYMLEYPIARMYADCRIQTIYGGTTEIMKEIIGKSLGL